MRRLTGALLFWRLRLTLSLLIGLAGCVVRPARVVHAPALAIPPGFSFNEAVAAAEGPALWLGPEWTYDGPQPVTFEVWSSTNLVDWVLATNTVALRVLFPPKPCEFYRVRTRDELGQVSDWAKVPE